MYNLLQSSIICHSERSEESKAFHPRQYSFVERGFRFLTPLRYVRNDSGASLLELCTSNAKVSFRDKVAACPVIDVETGANKPAFR